MKNVIKKVLATTLAATMVFASSLTSFAAKFTDVSATDYAWAIDSIESMADRGIVKGYGDGTFAPAKTVSKLEALVMLSRILGVEDEQNENLIEASNLVYGDEVAEFELAFGETEMVYLLGKGVFTTDEIEDYINDLNCNEPLKRYEAATILTKALYADKNISSELIAALDYTDVSDIPASAKKYVAYVDSENIMNGMEDGSFSPNTTITRAQAAVIFDRFSQKCDSTFRTGLVASVDQTARKISIKESEEKVFSHTLAPEIMLRFNGALISVNDIEAGYHATVTYVDNKVYSIDFNEIAVDDVVYGVYVGTATTSAKGTTITVNVLEEDKEIDTSKKTTYRLSEDCVITYEGSTCSVSALKSGYSLKLTIRKGEVAVIEAENKSVKISGRINEIIKDVPARIVIEENDGTVGEYLLAADATVTRNGFKVSASELLAGDTISSATLTYGKISSITVSSKSSTKTGDIVEVIISRSPRITLDIKGEEVTYFVTNDAKIVLNEREADFYDLRVGASVEFKAEGDTIVSLKGTMSSDVQTITGTVVSVDASFKCILLKVADTVNGGTYEKTVLVNDNASIVKYDTQKSMKLTAIKDGMTVTATGSIEGGIFKAGAIIVVG